LLTATFVHSGRAEDRRPTSTPYGARSRGPLARA